MAIFVEDRGLKRIINVLSIERKEIEYLKRLLEEKSFTHYEMYFYDIEVITAKVVNIIALSMDSKKIKIYIQKKLLRDYMVKLGIPAILIRSNQGNFAMSSIKAVVIGGSTGSLEKIIEITKKISLANIPIFVIQHIGQEKQNLLPDIINDYTKYSAILPEDNTIVEPGNLYAAPSGYHMIVRDGLVHLTKDQPVNYARPSIDVLFESLSIEYKEGLLAVLLCGYGKDGTGGLKEVKKRGGQIIVEEPEECVAKDMIVNALKGETYTIMKVDEIINYINNHISDNIDQKDVVPLLKRIYEQYGYDFLDYQPDSITRRISNYISKEKSTSFSEMINNINQNNESISELLSGLTVKTTEFFRDGKVYSVLRNKILPYLNSFPSIKIWCAGCSTGEEPYSIAILLEEAGMLDKSLIYATDLSFNNILQAQNGLFSIGDIKKYEVNYKDSGGNRSLADYFILHKTYGEIKKRFKENILFFQHSLVDSGVINEFQLILCRNVLMYFNYDLQKKTINLFSESLDKSGFLVLGKSESINSAGGPSGFALVDNKYKMYKKKYDE